MSHLRSGVSFLAIPTVGNHRDHISTMVGSRRRDHSVSSALSLSGPKLMQGPPARSQPRSQKLSVGELACPCAELGLTWYPEGSGGCRLQGHCCCQRWGLGGLMTACPCGSCRSWLGCCQPGAWPNSCLCGQCGI